MPAAPASVPSALLESERSPARRAEFALIDASSVDAGEVAAWRELAADAIEDNAFFAPELILPAVDLLQEGRVQIAVVRDGTRWLAAMPVERRQVAGPVVAPAVMGWVHRYSYLGTPLVRVGADGPAVVQTLLDGLFGLRGSACLVFRRTRVDGPVHDLVVGALARLGSQWHTLHAFHRPVLERGRELRLNSKRASELRRLTRRMSEKVGPVAFEESASEAAVDAFMALEHSGWKGRTGSSLRSAGAEPYVRGFLGELAQRDDTRLTVLTAGGRPAAAVCDIVSGTTRFGFKIGYDESLGRYSPGALLLARESRAFLEDPGRLEVWDSCVSVEHSLNVALWPGTRPIGTLLAAAPGPLGTAIVNALPAALKARGVIRRSLRRTTRT